MLSAAAPVLVTALAITILRLAGETSIATALRRHARRPSHCK